LVVGIFLFVMLVGAWNISLFELVDSKILIISGEGIENVQTTEHNRRETL